MYCMPQYILIVYHHSTSARDQSTLARANGTCANPELFPHLFTQLFVQILIVFTSWLSLLAMWSRISSCTIAKVYAELQIRVHQHVWMGHVQPLNCFPICLHSCSCKYLSCVHRDCWWCDRAFLADCCKNIRWNADQSTLARANETCTTPGQFPHPVTQMFVQIFIVCSRSEYISACKLDMCSPWSVSPSVCTVVRANIWHMYIVIVGYVIPCF